MSERDIFLAARAITGPDARAAYLNDACAGNAALRKRVERLLRADRERDSILDVPAAAPPDLPQAAADAPSQHPEDDIAPEQGSEESLGFLEPPVRSDSLGRLGHYEVLEVLGRGGFGIVFRAFDETLQRVVAVKVLAPEMAATSPARKRFLREARSAAQVRHDNVVQVHAVEEQPLPYLVMEFIPGETLQQRIDRTGPLEVPEVLRIGRQIAEGLAAAHATGLIHRDVKPANVLLERGPHAQVKLTDFGLARAADDASATQSGFVAGTPLYMSPEQARGEHLDHRSDLFSLGSVLYAMTTGRPPFRAEHALAVLRRVNEDAPRPILEIIPETPPWLCDVIARLHAKDPQERFQSAREVADVLTRCEARLGADPTLTTPSGIPQRKPQPSGRWKWVAAAAAAVLLPLIAFVVYALTPPAPPSAADIRPVAPVKQPIQDQASRERRAAERFRALKIDMSVVANGREIKLTGGAELPAEPFFVRYLRLNASVNTDAIEWLADLSRLSFAYVPPRDSDRWAEALAKHPAMVMINAYGSDLSDKGLAHISRLKNLEYLNLQGCRGVTGAGLRSLASCKSLEKLNLDGAMLQAGKYTLADLQELRRALPRLAFTRDDAQPIPELSADPDHRAALWLRSLGPIRVDVIEGDAVQPRVVFPEQPLPERPFRLVNVVFRGPEVNNLGDRLAEKLAVQLEGVRLTAAHLPQTESFTTAGLAKLVQLPIFAEVWYLSVSNCGVDDGMFAHLAKLPKLTNLDAVSLPNVTGKGIRALKGCPTFAHLTLADAPLTAEGLEELQQLPALEYLNISAVPCTEQHVAALAKLKVTTLILASAGINDTMADRLAGLQTLEKLAISGNPLTDKGLAELKKLKGLKALEVKSTQVTEAGVADLQKALPECKIEWK
jgi:serine/threonine protein kinase